MGSKDRGQPSCSRRGNSSANEGLIRKCSDHRTDDAQNDFSIKMSGTTGVGRGGVDAKPQNQKNLRNCHLERNGDKTCHIMGF